VSGGIVMSRPMVTIWELSASTVTSRADGVSGPATMVTWVKAEHRRPRQRESGRRRCSSGAPGLKSPERARAVPLWLPVSSTGITTV